MIKVLVGTSNTLKVQAVKEAFSIAFRDEVKVEGCQVESGVPAQPFDDKVFVGAINRARACTKKGNADFYVGIEGGITEKFGKVMAFSAVCIVDSKGRTSIGASGHFPLPREVIELIKCGKELGEAIDMLVGKHGIKYSEGAVGIFTRGMIDRRALYVHAIILTLAPFISPNFNWF